MEEMFKDILEKNEQIVKVYKPNKKVFWRRATWMFLVPLFWPHMLMILILSGFSAPFLVASAYKKRYYCYTNKRIIIRTGIVGVDYKSLEYKDITATSVSVGFLDKGLGTGTVEFGSPSSPIGDSQYRRNPYKFQAIQNPYDVMREIKEYKDTKK